jgi:hypothetical protein
MAGLADECVSDARVNSGTDGLLGAKTESTNNTLDAVKVKINSKESSLRATPRLFTKMVLLDIGLRIPVKTSLLKLVSFSLLNTFCYITFLIAIF